MKTTALLQFKHIVIYLINVWCTYCVSIIFIFKIKIKSNLINNNENRYL